MAVMDKRLIEKLNENEQGKHFKELVKQIPDASGKYEEITVEHEPINLLDKLQNEPVTESEPEIESEEAASDEPLLDEEEPD